MNAQIMDSLFIESYLMMNMEITFAGVRSWLEMSNLPMDDVSLFKVLLQPEKMKPEHQAEITRLIVYRYEDVFFQVNRTDGEGETDPLRDVNDPNHQLLLRLMNTRSLAGEQNAMIDLGVALLQDKERENPIYTSLHRFFETA